MYTELIQEIDRLRGVEGVPNELIEVLKHAFGKCTAQLRHRGPTEIQINQTQDEVDGLGEVGLPDIQLDITIVDPSLSYSPANPLNIHAPLTLANWASYYVLPADWDDPANGGSLLAGTINNGEALHAVGVVRVVPIADDNNPGAAGDDPNRIVLIVDGDAAMRKLFVDDDLHVNNNARVKNDLQVDGVFIANTFNFTNVTNYNASATQVLVHVSGTPQMVDIATLLTHLAGYNASADQSVGHDSGQTPEWQNDGTC